MYLLNHEIVVLYFSRDSGSLVWNEIMKQIEICISEKVKNHPDNGFRIQIQPNTLKR